MMSSLATEAPAGQISKSVSSGYIATLDGWRSIAIGIVVLSHAIMWGGFGFAAIIRIVGSGVVDTFLDGLGQRGVEIFFCISGFLITSRLIEEKEAFGRISLRNFYVRRASRILPAACTYLAVLSLLGMLKAIPLTAKEVFASLFFFRNYLSHSSSWFTGHFWSLSVEEHFYILWPSILAFLGLRRGRWAAIIAVIAVAAWRTSQWPLPGMSQYHTDVRLDGLLVGAIVALSFPRLKAYFLHRSTVSISILVLIYAACIAMPGVAQSVARLVQSIVIALLIVTTVSNRKSYAAGLLESSPLRWVGRLSYSIYLWQQLFFWQSGTAHRIEMPFRLIGALACAALSYYIVERPMIRIGHRLAPPATAGRGDITEPEARVCVASPAV